MTRAIANAIIPTVDDLRYAGELVKTDILENTAAGNDYTGTPFVGYNDTHPYWFSPSTGNGKFPSKSPSLRGERARATRLVNRLEKRGVKGTSISGDRKSIKFKSYAAFKQAFGSDVVDLKFIVPPHTLDAIEITTDKSRGEAIIAIRDPRAVKIGLAHQFGEGRMPKREFFGISEKVKQKISEDYFQRVLYRLRNET